MANTYRGYVEFKDSEGSPFVLRLGTNEFLSVKKQADLLDGREWQRFMLHQALIHGATSPGAEKQTALTLEDAGELLDDIGYLKADDLISLTRFGKNAKDAADEAKKQRAAAAKEGSANPPAAAIPSSN